MLGLLGITFLVLALADLVSHTHGPGKKEEPCFTHDWYALVDTEGNDQGLICGVCKKTPTMISEEHVPNE